MDRHKRGPIPQWVHRDLRARLKNADWISLDRALHGHADSRYGLCNEPRSKSFYAGRWLRLITNHLEGALPRFLLLCSFLSHLWLSHSSGNAVPLAGRAASSLCCDEAPFWGAERLTGDMKGHSTWCSFSRAMKKSRHAIWFHDRIERELPKLRSRARSLTNSEPAAEDLLQETVKNALSSPLSDGKGHNIRGWLFTIMRHAYVDTIRRNKRRPGDDAGDADPEHLVAGVIGQRPELQIDLLRALDSLNSEHREVITLIGINGLTYDEAAEVLGVSMDAIRSRLFRARSALRSAMNGRNPGSLPSARGPESR